MRFKFKSRYFVGIFIALIIIGISFYVTHFLHYFERWFWASVVIALVFGSLQIWADFARELKRQKQIELQFLEFTRSLVESVKGGISVPNAIRHVSTKDFGALTPYVKKLANQMEWGIPVHRALVTFAKDTENDVIKRAISIIIEADESGGDIEDILDSVTGSVANVKKMKEERKASVYSQVLQGYIVFFVFIAIMLVLQLWLFPKLGGMSETLKGSVGMLGGLVGKGTQMNLDTIFFSLIMIQGFFAGVMIGKFSEGTIKQGLIHSAVLMTSAALIITTAKGGI